MKYLMWAFILSFNTLRGAALVNVIVTDLNHDNIKDTVTLFRSAKECYFCTYDIIRVSLTGGVSKTFNARYGWEKVDKKFWQSHPNSINTDQLFLAWTDSQSVLLLFGHMGEYRFEFSMINIENNDVRMAFDHLYEEIDVGIPVDLTDMDNDGRLDFIFTTYREGTGSADLNGTCEFYCPFWVHTISDSCAFNKPLTKKYNEEHYVFAGFDYNEKIIVFRPSNRGRLRAYTRNKQGKRIWLTP